MALDIARQRISAAEEDLMRIEAALAGDPKIKADDHPKVKQMLAARDEALLQPAPHHHRVAARRHRLQAAGAGQLRRQGVPSMAVVADRELWIEANFKETELTRVRAGPAGRPSQVDTYPDVAMHRQGRQHRPGDGRGVRGTAAAERDRQLGQGGAAHPGAHRRHLRARAIRRCASA